MNDICLGGNFKPIVFNAKEQRRHISNGGAINVINSRIILISDSTEQ
jgi:hypothetical protein